MALGFKEFFVCRCKCQKILAFLPAAIVHLTLAIKVRNKGYILYTGSKGGQFDWIERCLQISITQCWVCLWRWLMYRPKNWGVKAYLDCGWHQPIDLYPRCNTKGKKEVCPFLRSSSYLEMCSLPPSPLDICFQLLQPSNANSFWWLFIELLVPLTLGWCCILDPSCSAAFILLD